jgi:heme exporter protein C
MPCWWLYHLFYSHISGETEKIMLNLLRKRWWKFVSVAFLLVALVAGMYFPLSSGITAVGPEKATEGQKLSLAITTYNTNFENNKVPKVYLRGNELFFCANAVTILSPVNLTAVFNIPDSLGTNGTKPFNVVIDDAVGGTFFLRSAVVLAGSNPSNGATHTCAKDLEIHASANMSYPYREILYESIRNLFYHVPLWFAMLLLLVCSFGSSIAYLSSNNMLYDVFAKEAAYVAMLFGALGIVTGMTWANFTWGTPWTNDPKLNGAAVGMLTYLAYFVLRGSLTQRDQRAKVSAVYGIFAFIIYIIFIFVLPRLSDSLHPGNGGNPAFSNYDLDNRLRPVFYAAVIGFTGIGYWIMSLRIRYTLLLDKQQEQIDTPYESMVS